MAAEKKKMNLAQKLIEIRKAVPYLRKEAKGFNYQYAKGSILLGLLRPKMDELSVLLSYSVLEMETENVDRVVKNKTIQTGRVRMKFMFEFIDADNPTDTMTRVQWFQGIGDDIQDIGGYNTYALRYFLFGFFNIPSDEGDPDDFENAKNRSRPPELVNDTQLESIKDLINGHDDILIRILQAYKKLESIRSDQYDLVIATIKKLISDKEKNHE